LNSILIKYCINIFDNSCVLLFLFGFYILLFFIICFNFVPLHHHHNIIMFSFYHLELNLHTYLTTWLSSCLVRIFSEFLTILCLKMKNHKQSAIHKMWNLKINSRQKAWSSSYSKPISKLFEILFNSLYRDIPLMHIVLYAYLFTRKYIYILQKCLTLRQVFC